MTVINPIALKNSQALSRCLNVIDTFRPDCLVEPDTVERVLKSMFGGTDFNLAERPLPEAVMPVEAIPSDFMLVRRCALEQVGLLDEGYFMHCVDLDWCSRLRHAGWSILFVPDVAVTHVKGACSADNRVRVEWHKHLGMARYYRKFFRERYPLPLLWLVYLAIWARFGAKASILFFRRAP